MNKLSPTFKRLVIGSIALGLVAVIALLLRGSPDSGLPAGDQTTSRTARAPGRTSAPGLAPSGKQAPGSTAPRQVMGDAFLESIIKKDPKLAKFMRYHKMVVPDQQHRDEYRKMLSDPDMMNAMAKDLMDPGTGHPQEDEFYRRLMLVDYFDAALTWKENPKRDELLALTREIITKDNFLGDQDGSRRQVLGGTKMELYRLLYAQDAAKAGEMVAQAKGTRMEALLSWMAEEELRRRAGEAKVMKEADELARSN